MKHEMVPTEEELLLCLRDKENAFVERKLFSDGDEWLKTAVAFANSVPVGYPGVLFIGVKDDGTPEERAEDLEKIQQAFSKKLSKAYPPIFSLPSIVHVNGRQVLAIIIPGSPERPHFTGKAFIRAGDRSIEASESQFAKLIAERQSQVYELLKWRGKKIWAEWFVTPTHPLQQKLYRYGECELVDCNQFYVTLSMDGRQESIPLRRVGVSFRYYNNMPGCLALEIYPAA